MTQERGQNWTQRWRMEVWVGEQRKALLLQECSPWCGLGVLSPLLELFSQEAEDAKEKHPCYHLSDPLGQTRKTQKSGQRCKAPEIVCSPLSSRQKQFSGPHHSGLILPRPRH